MLDRIEKVATIILTLAGIFFLPREIIEATGSEPVGVAISVVLLTILGMSALSYLFPTLLHRRFGIRRFKARAILTHKKELITIDETFKATIEGTKDFVFLETPPASDLVDLIDVLPEEEMAENFYSSRDSTAQDIVRKNPNTLAVFWRPVNDIVPFSNYLHNVSYSPPSLYGDDAFYHAFHVDREVGFASYEFNCAHEVEHAISFVLPPYQSKVTLPRLYKHSVGHLQRKCEQPIVSDDGAKITWRLTNPKIGRTYVLFAWYRDCFSIFEEEAKSMLFRTKILQALPRFKQQHQQEVEDVPLT